MLVIGLSGCGKSTLLQILCGRLNVINNGCLHGNIYLNGGKYPIEMKVQVAHAYMKASNNLSRLGSITHLATKMGVSHGYVQRVADERHCRARVARNEKIKVIRRSFWSGHFRAQQS